MYSVIVNKLIWQCVVGKGGRYVVHMWLVHGRYVVGMWLVCGRYVVGKGGRYVVGFQCEHPLSYFMLLFAEVTINRLKEKLKEFEEKIEDRVQVL